MFLFFDQFFDQRMSEPKFTLFTATNALPAIFAEEDAKIWERIIILPFVDSWDRPSEPDCDDS
jgi:phage/plasmid-associated DNA primase